MKVDAFHGHGGPGNNGSQGLHGWNEIDYVIDFGKRLLKILRQPAYKGLSWIHDIEDKINHEQDAVELYLETGALCILYHTNSLAGGQAHGTETFYLFNNDASKDYAKRFNDATVTSLGTSNRGVKSFTDYYLVPTIRRKTDKAILVELFFGNNQGDYDKYMANRDKLAEAHAKIIIELCGGEWQGAGGVAAPKPNKRVDELGREITHASAIGSFYYVTQYKNERVMNVHSADEIINLDGDGYYHNILKIGTDGARYVFDLENREQDYRKEKGTKIIGLYVPLKK